MSLLKTMIKHTGGGQEASAGCETPLLPPQPPQPAIYVSTGLDVHKIDDCSMILAAEEGPGIINWCIEGYREYLEVGLNEPDIVKAATSEYPRAWTRKKRKEEQR